MELREHRQVSRLIFTVHDEKQEFWQSVEGLRAWSSNADW